MNESIFSILAVTDPRDPVEEKILLFFPENLTNC